VARFAHTLLRASHEPTIVATSREPLRAEGEQLYRLQPLALPEPNASLAALQQSEAVRLFIDRAREQDPHFRVDEASAPSIGRICIRLDGIPLALELAAAQVNAFPIEIIESRLEDRFQLLIGGSRTAIPRQQTLRATLDWSYALLSAEEQRAWISLSVIAGTFKLEAAEAVMIRSAEGGSDARELMERLVMRSLVNAQSRAGQTRYHLLETLKTYAAERLSEAGHGPSARERHAAYFRALLDRAITEWPGSNEANWLACYASEIDNIRAALDWPLHEGNNPRVIVGLAGSCGPLFMSLSLMQEGRQRLDAARALATPDMDLVDRGRLWLWSGVLGESDRKHALECYEAAIRLFRASSETMWLGDALMRRARMLVDLGMGESAAESLAEAGPMLIATALPRLQGNYYSTEGHVRMRAGNLAEAVSMEEMALMHYREGQLDHAVLASFGNLANLKWATGQLDAAILMFKEAIAMRRASRTNRQSSLGFALANFAGALTENGELDEAACVMRECVPLLLQAGLAWVHLDHWAYHKALTGGVSGSALIAGRSDAEYTSRGVEREINERRVRTSVQKLLSSHFGPTELQTLLEEGGRRLVNDVCRIAIE